MRYLSVCSGIEAATVAWEPLGWEAAAFSEIEAFPRAVLAHHYPDIPLHGDFTTIGADEYGPVDLLVGGTPCQSFSIAGLRGGLADDRGNLALEFLRLAQRTRAKWLVWENVPGVLSSEGGRDFGSILGGLVELGYGFAYRVLDAQHFGVPQRRRRVFVVGYLGDWRRAAAVLFERHSLSGHPAPRRETRAIVAALTADGVGTCGADDNQGQAGHIFALQGGGRTSQGSEGSGWKRDVCFTLNTTDEHAIAHSLRADGFDASEDGTGRGTPLIVDTLTSNDAHSGYRDEKGLVAYSIMPMNSGKDYVARETDVAQPVMAGGNVASAQGGDLIAFQSSQSGVREVEAHATLDSNNGSRRHNGVMTGSAVRRLTPRECERLQGFPDDYTLVSYRGKPAADGPRYKALGNSMAVPCMRWLGERIQAVATMTREIRHAA